jgi:hypothetical protein
MPVALYPALHEIMLMISLYCANVNDYFTILLLHKRNPLHERVFCTGLRTLFVARVFVFFVVACPLVALGFGLLA